MKKYTFIDLFLEKKSTFFQIFFLPLKHFTDFIYGYHKIEFIFFQKFYGSQLPIRSFHHYYRRKTFFDCMDFAIKYKTLIFWAVGCQWLDSNLFQFHLSPMEHLTLTLFRILSCYRHWIYKDLHNLVCEICFWIILYHYLFLNLFKI